MVREVKITYTAEAEKNEVKFWNNKSYEEKLSIVQVLREQYIALFNKEEEYAESRKRLLPKGTPSEEEFIGLLNKYKVQYMIVGAYALALYTRPRNTGDIDIFINKSKENSESLMKVIKEFGFENAGIEESDFTFSGRIVQLGVSPIRIDIINDIDGINFSDAYERLEKFKFGNITANFISKIDIIKNKKSSNRKKDQADLDELEKFDEMEL
jgi:hypothetical protein